jgi:hypothetical protein
MQQGVGCLAGAGGIKSQHMSDQPAPSDANAPPLEAASPDASAAPLPEAVVPPAPGGRGIAVSIGAIVNYAFALAHIVLLLWLVVHSISFSDWLMAPARLSVSYGRVFASLFPYMPYYCCVVATLAVVAGLGVMNRRQWGRAFTLVLGVLAIAGGAGLVLPMPIIAGVYFAYGVIALVLMLLPKVARELR